jgi:metallophosphoesterase (TIGR03767 family)
VLASRRTVLKGAAAAAAVAATGGVTAFPTRRAAAAPLGRPEGTTLDSTVRRGPALNDLGYRRLVSGPGEPHVVRDELGTAPKPGREGRRTALLSFAHLTDIHVTDVQSPARVEFLDRYDDEPRAATLFSSAYRPQEVLCTQLADGVIGAVRRAGAGPVTGTPLAFAICTGDNTDNQQYNELDWHLRLMDGEPLTPNSGGPSFEGVHDGQPTTYDVHYWHPDGTPDGKVDDNARRLHGFPTMAGLLDVALAQFTPNGVGVPWYSCFGNHDGLVQGNFPSTFQLEQVAVGSLKVVQLPPGVSFDDLARGDSAAAEALLGPPPVVPVRQVTADADRRIVSRRETVEEHFRDGGLPLGHGFTAQNVADGTAYYVFDASPLVRGIVLDTVNPNGESSGSLDRAQLAWLREQLEASTGEGRDRLVVVFSHHSVGSMTNQIPVGSEDPADWGQRVLGEEVEALLLEFPNVVLWVNGHTHRNQVFAHPRPDGGGFWEVNTAAHIDFPCQARLMELVDNRDGTLSVFATVVDADVPLQGPSSVSGSTPVRELAAFARELSANDWQDEGSAREGAVEDRNVELLVAAPFALGPAATPQQPSTPADPPAPVGRTLPTTGGQALVAAAALGAAGLGALAARAGRVQQAEERH